MADVIISTIIACVLITILVLALFVLILYESVLIFNKQFHTTANIILLNVAIWHTLLTLITITFIVMSFFYPSIYVDLCRLVDYVWSVPICGVIDSLVLMSTNQLFRVLYPTNLSFKKKRFVLKCAGIQWVLAAIIPIPYIGPISKVSKFLKLVY